MGKLSGIAWTNSTFNPVIGCTKIGPGCDNCYAEALDHRFHKSAHWGAGAPRKITSDKYWRTPILWNMEAKQTCDVWRVFCASQADVFDNEWPEGVRERLWDLIKCTPHLTWLLLTKRIGNVAKMLPPDWGVGYPNVQLGITVVNQEEFDRDVPKLKAIRAKVRWLSVEPQLDNIRITNGLGLYVDWIICGGESEQHGRCRPFQMEWAINLRVDCKYYGIKFFMKQLGSKATMGGVPYVYTGKGDEPDEWPDVLRVRDFPA